jgi:molecular chaperone HscB
MDTSERRANAPDSARVGSAELPPRVGDNDVRAFGTCTPGGGGMAACWSCRGPLDAATLFCETCHAVQPPGQADHFARLDLPPGFAVDAALLNRRYFERQRLLHPDRFATRSARERALSQSQATAINEAYETLKDPLRRADYLLHLRRVGANPEGCHLVNDLELLQEALELREALAEAESPTDVAALSARARQDIDRCVAEVAEAFAEDDLDCAARLTTRLKYLRKLADDCRARRGKLAGMT